MASTSYDQPLKIIFQTFEDGFLNKDATVKKISHQKIIWKHIPLNVQGISTSPEATLKLIKEGLAGTGHPLIFLYGRSGSGKSSTVMGREGAEFRGLVNEWFDASVNVGVQVMEFQTRGYRDLALSQPGFEQRPIETLKVITLEELPNILKKKATARTLLNSESSRSFISITLFDQSNYDSRVTIIDMPGTENRTALDVPTYKKDEREKLIINSKFIMKNLNSFTNIMSTNNNTSGSNHLFTPLAERIINSTDFDNIFLIACAAGPLSDENSKEIFHFLAKIKGVPDDYVLGGSRTPIAPASMARNSLATPVQQSFQLSPLNQLKLINTKLKAELDAAQKECDEANRQIAELTQENVDLSHQVSKLIETRNRLQRIITQLNNELVEVKRLLGDLRQQQIATERNLQERIANEERLQLQIDELNRRSNVRRSSISVVARRSSSSSAHSHPDSDERHSDVLDRSERASDDDQNTNQETDTNEQTNADDHIDSDHDRASHGSTAAANSNGSDGDEEYDNDDRAANVNNAGNNDSSATEGSHEGNGSDGGDAVGVDDYLENHDWEAEFSDPTQTALGIEGLMVPAFKIKNEYYQVFNRAEFSAFQWEQIMVDIGKGRYRCTICGVDTSSSRVKTHVFEQHGSGRLYCKKCRLPIAGVSNIAKHQKNCRGVLYECPQCNEKFSAQVLAYNHCLTCTPELPIPVHLKPRRCKRLPHSRRFDRT